MLFPYLFTVKVHAIPREHCPKHLAHISFQLTWCGISTCFYGSVLEEKVYVMMRKVYEQCKKAEQRKSVDTLTCAL